MKKFARMGSLMASPAGGAPWMIPIKGIKTAPVTSHAATA